MLKVTYVICVDFPISVLLTCRKDGVAFLNLQYFKLICKVQNAQYIRSEVPLTTVRLVFRKEGSMKVGGFNKVFVLAVSGTFLSYRRGETCSHLQICVIVSLVTVRGRSIKQLNLHDFQLKLLGTVSHSSSSCLWMMGFCSPPDNEFSGVLSAFCMCLQNGSQCSKQSRNV